ncbi:MAG: pilus assembly protein PilM [Sedimentisphaerales bacterium]|nr:pilus assembly protein PilM [Sedimentisphaerales bacterium]
MTSHSKIALGIDVNPHQVSAALVERVGQAYRVVAAASDELPDSAAQPGSAEQTKALSRTVRKLGRRARLAHMKAALSLSANPLVIQILDMPRHMPANVREFVEGELKQYVALSGTHTLSDFCGIGPVAEGRRRMLTVAAGMDQILAAVNSCTRAGVTVEAVEPSLLAYARAFHAGGTAPIHGRNVLIAILGGSLTVSLFCNGTLDFVRVRDVPSDMREQESLFQWLANELKTVTRYHGANAGAESGALHARLIVQNPQRSAKELEPVLRARTGIESLVVTHADEAVPDSPIGQGEAPALMASRMAVGAALKMLNADSDDMKINLLPGQVTHARSFARHALLTAIAAAFTFLGVLVATVLLTRTADTTRTRVEQTKIDEQLYTTRALIAQDKFLDQEIARVRRELDPLQKLLQGKSEVDWSAVLTAVRRVTPASVCITELSSGNSESLSLKGLALSCDAAQSFARGLDAGEPFASASVARITTRQQDARSIVEYQIDCSMKPAREEN